MLRVKDMTTYKKSKRYDYLHIVHLDFSVISVVLVYVSLSA